MTPRLSLELWSKNIRDVRVVDGDFQIMVEGPKGSGDGHNIATCHLENNKNDSTINNLFKISERL